MDLKLAPQVPPPELFHGTARRFVAAISQQGLLPQSRQHVHLSTTRELATRVGARHGSPVVLVMQASRMHADGYHFFLSENGVWLTDRVPPRYLGIPPGGDGT